MFDGSYLLEYYYYDIPFLIAYAILCIILIERQPKQLLKIYFPILLFIVLTIYWSAWGIGPDYSWRIKFNSVIIDLFSHGLLFYSVYLISKILSKKKHKHWFYIILFIIYFVLALILLQVIVLIISWLLQS